MSNPFQIALVQAAATPDVRTNLDRAEEAIRRAVGEKAQVICLPELFAWPYFCQTEDPANFDFAIDIPGPLTRFQAVAKELEAVLVLPVFEKRARGVYHNSAVVIDATGEIRGTYRKMHIPDDPQFYEKFYFAPGDNGFLAWETAYGRVGVCICWDQWFPEAARLTALAGADVIFYPTAIGWLPAEKPQTGERQLGSWETVQRAHAIANGCYVAAANRIGFEPSGTENEEGIEFWGSSFVADPAGSIVAQAGSKQQEIIVATVDPERIEAQRREWPFFRDRRVDAYGDLTRLHLER